MPYSEKMASAGDVPAEYSVYVYFAGSPEERKESWAKTKTTSNPMRAMAEAEKLHASRKYPKVEIKMKTFEGVDRQPVDSVFKVYQAQTNHYAALREIALLTGLFVMGIGFFAYLVLHGR